MHVCSIYKIPGRYRVHILHVWWHISIQGGLGPCTLVYTCTGCTPYTCSTRVFWSGTPKSFWSHLFFPLLSNCISTNCGSNPMRHSSRLESLGNKKQNWTFALDLPASAPLFPNNVTGLSDSLFPLACLNPMYTAASLVFFANAASTKFLRKKICWANTPVADVETSNNSDHFWLWE